MFIKTLLIIAHIKINPKSRSKSLSSHQWNTMQKFSVTQWVKNPIAEAQVAGVAWVPSPARHRRLRIWHCYSWGIGHSHGPDSIPGSGNSKCLRCWHLKKKNCVLEKKYLIIRKCSIYTVRSKNKAKCKFAFKYYCSFMATYCLNRG